MTAGARGLIKPRRSDSIIFFYPSAHSDLLVCVFREGAPSPAKTPLPCISPKTAPSGTLRPFLFTYLPTEITHDWSKMSYKQLDLGANTRFLVKRALLTHSPYILPNYMFFNLFCLSVKEFYDTRYQSGVLFLNQCGEWFSLPA